MEDYLGDSYASSDQLSGVSEESVIDEEDLEEDEVADGAASGNKNDDSKGMIYPTTHALPPPS